MALALSETEMEPELDAELASEVDAEVDTVGLGRKVMLLVDTSAEDIMTVLAATRANAVWAKAATMEEGSVMEQTAAEEKTVGKATEASKAAEATKVAMETVGEGRDAMTVVGLMSTEGAGLMVAATWAKAV